MTSYFWQGKNSWHKVVWQLAEICQLPAPDGNPVYLLKEKIQLHVLTLSFILITPLNHYTWNEKL